MIGARRSMTDLAGFGLTEAVVTVTVLFAVFVLL